MINSFNDSESECDGEVSEAFNLTVEVLDFSVCGMLDMPPGDLLCSTRNASICFRCPFRTVYLTGESINDVNATGHLVCRVLAICVVMIAFTGFITNSLVIRTIQNRKAKRSFDFLLCTLSHVDNFCLVSSVSYVCAHVAFYDNFFDRGKMSLYLLKWSCIATLFWRSVSMYLTLLITMERYSAIASPLRSRAFYSLHKTKLQAFVVFLVSALFVLPAFFRFYVGPNIYGEQEGGLDVPSFRHLNFTFFPTGFVSVMHENRIWFRYTFQYWIPVPALFLFHILTYRKIQLLKQNRQQLTCSQKRELQPAQMFLPVVVVFLCTNIWPMIMHTTIQVWGLTFREIWVSFYLATAVNCSVNFWIYYFRGSGFRKEAKNLFIRGKPQWTTLNNISGRNCVCNISTRQRNMSMVSTNLLIPKMSVEHLSSPLEKH